MNEVNSIVYGMDTLLGVMKTVARFPVAELTQAEKRGSGSGCTLDATEKCLGDQQSTPMNTSVKGASERIKGCRPSPPPPLPHLPPPSPFPPPPSVLTPFLPGRHDVSCSNHVLFAITD